MESYFPRCIGLPSTETSASPFRQINPVSRSPVSNFSEDPAAVRMIRPYARWSMVLLLGETEICRPVCTFVFRKTIFSTAIFCVFILLHFFLDDLAAAPNDPLRNPPKGMLLHHRHNWRLV